LHAGGETSPTVQLVDVGTHHLQIRCEGQGSPTVVIDTGIADTMENLGPLPRHSGREAEELKSLLDDASVPGPYVVVGHSLGALNVQVFAAKYSEDVVGIVLLDPPPLSFIRAEEYTSLLTTAERMTAEWQAIADAGVDSEDAQEWSRADFFRMIASEHREMFGESATLVSTLSSFGETPLLVMAAGRPNSAFGDIAAEYQRYWIEQSRALSHRSSRGEFVLVEESTHHLHLDVPDLVAEGVLSIVDRARGE